MSILKKIFGKKETGCCSSKLDDAIKKAKDAEVKKDEKVKVENTSSCCKK